MNKPPFDPNQPFQVGEDTQKPPFDPNQSFQEVGQSKPGFFDTISKVSEEVKTNPRYGYALTIPALTTKAYEGAQRLFGKAGEMATGELSKSRIQRNPIFSKIGMGGNLVRTEGLPAPVAAGIGTMIQMQPDIMSSAIGIEGKPPIASKAGFLQKMGAKGVNYSAGIKPQTIGSLMGQKNPIQVGTDLARSMVKEGAFGLTPESTFDKTKVVLNKFGQDVGNALEAIKNTGIPTEVPVNEALNPLIDKWISFKDSALSGNRVLAKPFEEIYGKLADLAEKNGGKLSLDHLREAMQETGEALSRAMKDSPKQKAYSELYRALADTRDTMVNKIADSANNPELAQNLLNANKGFSRYSRIMPDIRKKGTREAVSKFPLFAPFKGLTESIQPFLSKTAVELGESVPSRLNAAIPFSNLGTRKLSEDKVREYLKEAKKKGFKGEEAKNEARRLAKEAGY